MKDLAPLIRQLKLSTVRILDSYNNKVLGTGFWISKDLIATCFHVIEKQGEEVLIQCYGMSGLDKSSKKVTVLHTVDRPVDIAILKVADFQSNYVAYLEGLNNPFVHSSLYTFGYSADHPMGDAAKCTLEGEVHRGEITYAKLQGGEIIGGFSGAPVLDENSGKVMGIMRLERTQTEGGFAIPIEYLYYALQDKDLQLRELQSNYHRRSDLWRTLLPEAQSKYTYLTGEPPKPPKEFLGRNEEIRKIHSLLRAEDALALVSGMGGIGKTILAQAYFKNFKHEYDYLAWCYCEQGIQEGMMESLLLSKLNLKLQQETSNAGKYFELVCDQLRHLSGKKLMVLDNVDDAQELRTALPVLDDWQILITSRATQVRTVPSLEVVHLKVKAALQLFYAFFPAAKAEETLLLQLLEEIDYHTLTIELLAKNLRNLAAPARFNVAWLCGELAERGILGLRSMAIEDSPYLIAKGKTDPKEVMGVMFDLQKLDTKRIQLLQYFTVFPNDFVPENRLSELLEVEDEDYFEFREHLQQLVKQGWLQYSKQQSEQSYKLHALHREILIDKHPPTENAFEDLVLNVKQAIHFEKNLPDRFPYMRYAESLIEKGQGSSSAFGWLCMYYINLVIEYGLYDKAILAGEKGLSIFQTQDDLYNIAVANSRIGDIYKAKEQWDKALSYFEQDLQLAQKLYEAQPNSLSYTRGLAVANSRIGDIYKAKEQWDKALSYFEQDLQLAQKLCEAQPNSLLLLSGMAIAYEKMGYVFIGKKEWEQALFYFQEDEKWANVLLKQDSGSQFNRELMAECQFNLAVVHRGLGDREQALACLEVAKVLFEALWKETERPSIGVWLEKVVDFWRGEGD